MAVPKKKTSKSKRNMRRSHYAIKHVNVVIDKETGEYRLPHRMSAGRYNNKEIIAPVDTNKADEE